MTKDIHLQNNQKKLKLNLPQIQKIIQKILKNKDVRAFELSVVFITYQKISALNKQFLNRQYATDVLAFEQTDEFLDDDGFLRGDIFISTDAVIKQSKMFDRTINDELVLYIVHGLLHLLGYDDHSPKDIKAMRTEENRLMKILEKDCLSVILD